MHAFSSLRLTAAIAALLFTASCKCEPDQCPAFSDQGTGYILPAERDSIVFVNAGGGRIAFGVVDVSRSSAHKSGTKYNPLGPCSPNECSSSGNFDARSADSRNGSFRFSASFAAEGGNNGTAVNYRDQIGHLLGFDFNLPATGDTSTLGGVRVNETLGPHVYDTLLVRQRDTLGTAADSLAIWRVYIHRPEGVVGFEDRVTGSLFYRE